MKKNILVAILLSSFYFSAQAQTKSSVMTDQEITDRIAIKELVDTFSILADQKETDKQRFLFTEDATSETFVDGKSVSKLTGRKQLGDAFGNFLKNFETVYHMNGQLSLTMNGDKASGISYCMVTLIGVEGGKKMKTAIGVYYNDEYVKQDGHWLIAKRKATFAWQDKTELSR
jgi:hypothetical protein